MERKLEPRVWASELYTLRILWNDEQVSSEEGNQCVVSISP